MMTAQPASFSSLNASIVGQLSDSRVFEELLDAEVVMNPAKLREAARQGIPSHYRGTVYRYLLGVSSMDKSVEMTVEQMQDQDFQALEATYFSLFGGCAGGGSGPSGNAALPVGGGTSGGPVASANIVLPSSSSSTFRVPIHLFGTAVVDPWEPLFLMCRVPPVRDQPPLRKRLEGALRALKIAHSEAVDSVPSTLFALALPFAHVGKTACDVYHLTQALYSTLCSRANPLESQVSLREYCSIFLMLFHLTNDVLYLHFHSESVPYTSWLPDFVGSLLAKTLPLESYLRLLDTYLADCSESGGFPLHVFVCLALLSTFTEELMEMDGVQILQFLKALPSVDMDMVLQRALSLRETVLSRELL